MKKQEETTTREKAAGPARRKRSRTEMERLHQRISALLDVFEEQIKNQSLKISVTDYIRLLQFKREFDEQKPKDIEVKWVDSLREKNVSET